MRRLAALVLAPLAVVAAAVPAAALGTDPGRGEQWALDRIGAAPGDGAGVVVAVLDSGVDLDHIDLRDRLVPGIDLVDDDGVPQDQNGHGTHVAGIIAATAGNGAGIAGVAPGASLMPVRVLDDAGAGRLDDVVAGLRWAVDHGARVVNLSLSENTQALLGPSLSDALRAAWDAGVVPVIAAGNQYVLGSGFGDEPAIVVTATTADDGKPSYSSAVGGARWGMAAPGGENPLLGEEGAILSTWWVEGQADQYAYDAGTSMAAPHVAGAIAVLLGLGLSPADAVNRVLDTAVDLGPPGRDNTYGAGRLDLAAATAGLGGRPPAPAPAPDPGRSTTTTRPPASAHAESATAAPAPAPAPTSTTTTNPAGGSEEATGTVPSAPAPVAIEVPGPTGGETTTRALPVAVAALAAAAAGAASVRQHRRT